MSLRKALTVTALPVLLLAILIWKQTPPASMRENQFHLDGPIPGEITTLVDAKSRVDYSIPTLPASVLPNPCGGPVSVTLNLKDVYATWTDALMAERQVGLVYNANVWMSVSKKSTWEPVIANSVELPTLEEAFAATDFPTDQSMGAVRGHPAWVNELGPGFSCTSSSSSSSQESSTASSAIGGEDPGLGGGGSSLTIEDTLLGHLTWMESGLIVHLAGPYSAAQLTALAAQIQWI